MIGLVHSCSTLRRQSTGLNGGSDMQAYLQGLSCLFLPMSAQASIQNGFDVGTGWTVYFDDGTDVKVGDKLVFNGDNYLVRGIKAFTGIPSVSHVEATVVTENAHA